MFSFTFNQVSVFFYGFKSQLSNSYDNWYVQKYLKGIFHKGMLLIWKEYFTRAILSFSSPRCAIIARLNVIYTKFRRAMIAQLNKIWRVWACARAIARHSWPGLQDDLSAFKAFTLKVFKCPNKKGIFLSGKYTYQILLFLYRSKSSNLTI